MRIEIDGDGIYGREWPFCISYNHRLTGLQICNVVLAQEGQGGQAGGDSREDGHERGRTTCVVERRTECTQEASSEHKLNNRRSRAEHRVRLFTFCVDELVACEREVSVTGREFCASFIACSFLRPSSRYLRSAIPLYVAHTTHCILVPALAAGPPSLPPITTTLLIPDAVAPLASSVSPCKCSLVHPAASDLVFMLVLVCALAACVHSPVYNTTYIIIQHLVPCSTLCAWLSTCVS